MDYPKASWIPNNNFFPDSGKKTKLVIHGTAGGSLASGVARYFQSTESGNNPVSSNYIVDQEGLVVQCVLEKDGAWAQGVVTNPAYNGENPNNYCISIEFVKSATDNSNELTGAQMLAGFDLIADICKRNGFTFADIISHGSIDPVNRSRCPGPFPWNALKARLSPSVWQEQAAAARWKALLPNIPTGTGIYKSWLENYMEGEFFGPPTSLEYKANDWNGNSIVIQEFAYAWCEWSNGTPIWYNQKGKI
jgi:N-acetyl-anhydromuramyl-L-alanine amidase AmpD